MVTETFGHIGHSGRYDRSVESLTESLDRLIRTPNAVVISMTEQNLDSAKRDRAFSRPGWGFFQDDREDGYDENVLMWNKSRVTMLEAYAIGIANESYFRKSGTKAPTTKAVVGTFRLVKSKKVFTVIKYHASLDNTEQRIIVWLDEAKGVRRLVAAIRKKARLRKFIVSADYNRDWRVPKERALIRRNLAMPLRMYQSWNFGGNKFFGGTHGKRSLIDGDLSNMKVVNARLLPDDNSSDHRPYMITYKI